MKPLRILSIIVAVIALGYYAYNYFAKPDGKIYDVDKNHHVYYKGDGVTKEDAKKVGDFFTQIGLFKPDNEFDVQISADKEKDNLKIAYVVDKDKIATDKENGFMLISSSLSETVFNGKKMAVSLVDTRMDEIKSLGFTQPAQTPQQPQNNTNTDQTDDNK